MGLTNRDQDITSHHHIISKSEELLSAVHSMINCLYDKYIFINLEFHLAISPARFEPSAPESLANFVQSTAMNKLKTCNNSGLA